MTERGTGGFTLIEVVVALAILAITFGFAFKAFSGGFYRLDHGRNVQGAVLLARAELERVGHEIALEDGEITTRNADGFSSQIAISPFGRRAGDLLGHRIVVTVGWREGKQLRELSLETVRLGVAGADR